MTTGFSRLRVEDEAPSTDVLPAAAFHSATPRRVSGPDIERLVQDLAHANSQVTYLKGQQQGLIRERDELKRSLEAHDPKAFWRAQARESKELLQRVNKSLHKSRERETELSLQATTFSEEVDALNARIVGLKRALWDVWSSMPPDAPVKQQLWEVWGSL